MSRIRPIARAARPTKTKATLLGLSAAGAMALNIAITPWEGREYVVYADKLAGGLPTVCSGVTGWHLKVGDVYTDAQCDAMEAEAINRHEAGLRESLKVEPPTPTMAAFISWTYNVGVTNAQSSTLVKKANAGDLIGACNELPRWVFARGKVISGLENRRFRGDAYRVSERTLCLIGLDPSYETPLYERLYVQFKNWMQDAV